MKRRIVTGIIGGSFIALITYLGGFWFESVYFLITFIGVFELARVFMSDRKLPYEAIVNYLLLIAIYFVISFEYKISISTILQIFIACNFIFYITGKGINATRLSHALLIGMYVIVFMYYMIKLNDTPYVWLVYLIAFGTDTFAYFVGVTMGRHKLCPLLSPKKTIEGALGGVVGSTILSIIFFYILGINNIFSIIIFSILASILSMFGDLFASKIKREYAIKDYGNLLPGHGGILDRFDSILFVAPVVYYFVTYFI